MTGPRLLIAGIGNIFFGDDAFGVEVAQRLLRRLLPTEIKVVDFGIRGLDLTYALLEPYEAVILVDALPRGSTPGTLYVLEPELPTQGADEVSPSMDGHNLDPLKVLRLAQSMGGKLGRILVVGCEPLPFSSEIDMQMCLSPPVQAAVEEAIRLVESLAASILSGNTLPVS